jgi:hypothetical protein
MKEDNFYCLHLSHTHTAAEQGGTLENPAILQTETKHDGRKGKMKRTMDTSQRKWDTNWSNKWN